MNHRSYNPGACCGADCWIEWRDDQPCWGDVEWRDREIIGGFGDSWIHACQGHIKWADGGKYKPHPLQTLTPEEYEAAPVPSKEEIRAALKKGSEDLEKAQLSKSRRRNMSRTWRCYYCDIRYPFTVERCDCGTVVPKTREAELREVLQNLVNKLDEMEEPLNGCLQMSSVHGFPYPGPYWGKEVEVAKKILNDD